MKYLLIILLFISCGPQKRIKRILKKHPHLISLVDVNVVIHDTIMELDTFITQEYRDSFIISSDTIIETRRVIIERLNNRFDIIVKPDTITVLDTIFYTKEVLVKGKVVEVNKFPFWFWYLIGGLVLIIVFRKLFSN